MPFGMWKAVEKMTEVLGGQVAIALAYETVDRVGVRKIREP